jgi:DNA-binding NarL/FixJ family response regulator
VIAGDPGVGKTRLAAEAAELAERSGYAVQWLRATRSAGSIPLGALATLLPGGERDLPDGVELLALARAALADRAAGRRLVVCVDDGHLLDDASAALVHQLVVAGEAFAIVTMRREPAAPDALRALWKDELCDRIELAALARGDVEQLLTDVLGAALDGRSLEALWRMTRGSPLFLRELVRHGLATGVLAERGGVWRWRGAVRTDTRIAELIGLRVDAIGAGARSLLETVAAAGPLELDLLAARPAQLAPLEAAELVVLRRDGRRRVVDVAHPLHGEVVRARTPATRLDAIGVALADALERHGARRRDDVVRLASWRLAAGETGGRELFERAAAHALAALDAEPAERFARAAVAAGGGFDARMALGRALAARGRGEEAEHELARLEPPRGDDAARAALAIALARNRFWALGRAGAADEALRAAEAAVADADLRDDLVAQRVRLIAASGEPRAALAAAAPLLDDAGVGEPARLQIALGATEALFATGRCAEATALADAWLPAARRLRDALPHAEVVLLGMRAFALRFAGRLIAATDASEQNYALVLTRRSAQSTAVEAASLGLIWLARGRVRSALRRCRESAALLRDVDGAGMLALALAGCAQAAAQAGDADAARAAVDELERTPLGHRGFEFELGLGRAWAAAAEGEITRGRAHARDAAALARWRGQDAYAVRALHELCRLGDPSGAGELARLAEQVEGDFAPAAAAHAAALAAGDGAALVVAAERLAACGAVLAAAEAADAAAAAFRDAGRVAGARAAAERSAAWLRGCEGARPPSLLGAPVAAELTPREREVALLAARGLSSRAIAERLVVSVRTVDNHLQRAFRKLGVRGRGDLAGALRGAPEQSRAPRI